MTTLREAAQRALEALEESEKYGQYLPIGAIETLRRALADQSEQTLEMVEPIAYISGYVQGHPVIKTVDETVLLPVGIALYTAPPQRKPLTALEIFDLWKPYEGDPFPDKYEFARAIEQAHGIGGKE